MFYKPKEKQPKELLQYLIEEYKQLEKLYLELKNRQKSIQQVREEFNQLMQKPQRETLCGQITYMETYPEIAPRLLSSIRDQFYKNEALCDAFLGYSYNYIDLGPQLESENTKGAIKASATAFNLSGKDLYAIKTQVRMYLQSLRIDYAQYAFYNSQLHPPMIKKLIEAYNCFIQLSSMQQKTAFNFLHRVTNQVMSDMDSLNTNGKKSLQENLQKLDDKIIAVKEMLEKAQQSSSVTEETSLQSSCKRLIR